MMKVLVTGGNGLAGSALKKYATNGSEKQFYFISRNECDLSRVGGLFENMNKNYTFFMDNIKMNNNIIDACKSHKVERLINILSTCVFPDDNVTYPLTSRQMHNGPPHNSNMGYSYAKRMQDVGSKLFIESGHVIPALIHKVHLAKQNNFEIYGSGNAIRQFLFADDLAKIILEFVDMNLEEKYNSLIVSPPINDQVTIKELVDTICKIYKFTGGITYSTFYSDGQYKKLTDESELEYYIPNFNLQV
ncbi:CRE-GER-1 protein [Zopfochytrium polystomum]|nr:CRE-GER-1 protein [Zopfochytrium polystomum]